MPVETTYDLSGCACCGVDFCACTGMPSSLTATFTNVSCDAGYTGASVTLTWNGVDETYDYEGLINGKVHHFRVSCFSSSGPILRISPFPSTECEYFKLATATSCNPLDVMFTGVTLISVGGGGCGCVTGDVDIHITE